MYGIVLLVLVLACLVFAVYKSSKAQRKNTTLALVITGLVLAGMSIALLYMVGSDIITFPLA